MLHLILSKKHYLPAKNFEHSLKQCSQVRRHGGRACVEGCKISDRHKIKQCEMRPVCAPSVGTPGKTSGKNHAVFGSNAGRGGKREERTDEKIAYVARKWKQPIKKRHALLCTGLAARSAQLTTPTVSPRGINPRTRARFPPRACRALLPSQSTCGFHTSR